MVEFDLDRYLRNSKKVDLSGIDWIRVPDHPLSDGDVMCLHYMMDIETHTVIYLRDLLATRVAVDPQITAFLCCWVYEELWHGEAFSDFLRSYGIEVPAEPKLPDGSTPMPTHRNRWRDLRVRLGVGNGLGLAAHDARLDDDPRLRGHPHDVGRGQRAHNPDRLPRADAPLEPPGAPQAAAQGDPGRAPPFRLLSRPGEGPDAAIADRPPHGALGRSPTCGRRSARASRRRKRSTPWRSTCSATGPRDASRSARSTETIADVPGLEGMHLLEDYLDGALRRAAERPGWTGVADTHGPPLTPTAHAPPPAHWAQVGAVRAD